MRQMDEQTEKMDGFKVIDFILQQKKLLDQWMERLMRSLIDKQHEWMTGCTAKLYSIVGKTYLAGWRTECYYVMCKWMCGYMLATSSLDL